MITTRRSNTYHLVLRICVIYSLKSHQSSREHSVLSLPYFLERPGVTFRFILPFCESSIFLSAVFSSTCNLYFSPRIGDEICTSIKR